MIELLFVGWHYDGNISSFHDKVWIAFKIGNQYYCGWGKRGKQLKFKCHGANEHGQSMINVLIDKKSKPYGNYIEIDFSKINSVVPDFQDMVEQQLVMATLKNTII
jgi:hypothetical protein